MRLIGILGGAALLTAIGIYGVSHGAPGLTTTGGPAPKPLPNVVEPTRIGMNLGTPADYTQEWSFVDLIRTNGTLYVNMPGDGGRLINQYPTRHGRPYDIPKGTQFGIPIGEGNDVRVGSYRCSISPGWEVVGILGLQNKVSQSGTKFTMEIPKLPVYQVLKIVLRASVDKAALDTLSCVAKSTPPGEVFNPAFLDDIKPFAVIRFMDWMQANYNPTKHWAERPTREEFSLASHGAAVEDMVALANTVHADPWFCLPFDADADYVRRFATYVRDNLAHDRKAYVELSNEVWNTSFGQARDAVDRGKARYPGVPDYTAGDRFYADRVREVMAIWSEVFAGQRTRLVRVIASQAGWPERGEVMLKHADTWRSVDAYAVAPYFGGSIQDLPGEGKPRIDAMFARAPGEIDQAIGYAVAQKAVANRYGLPLVTYEAGQHYLGFNPAAQADMSALEQDPRMGDLYARYLREWQRRVGGLLVLFNAVGGGSWSAKAYTGQPLAQAPKMRAILDFIERTAPRSVAARSANPNHLRPVS